jgi:hypothetical protein
MTAAVRRRCACGHQVNSGRDLNLGGKLVSIWQTCFPRGTWPLGFYLPNLASTSTNILALGPFNLDCAAISPNGEICTFVALQQTPVLCTHCCRLEAFLVRRIYAEPVNLDALAASQLLLSFSCIWG